MRVAQMAMKWCSFFALYLLSAGSHDPAEMVAGGVTATLVTLLMGRLHARFQRTMDMKPVWLIYLWRIPLSMLSESWLLLIALFRRLKGRDVEGRFIEHHCPGCEFDRHDSSRRAFMTFGVCITPNSYLVSYDPEEEKVLLRQLVGRRISPVDRLFVELP